MKRKIVKRTGIGLLLLLLTLFAGATIKRVRPLAWGHKEVNTPMFGNEAINGYDPVAYFTLNKAVMGNKTYTLTWKDATWYFSSQENLALFRASPQKYTPQFGGYCAFAIGKGFTANTDPGAFTIIEGKLYLCANKKILDKWVQGGEENRKKSEENWK